MFSRWTTRCGDKIGEPEQWCRPVTIVCEPDATVTAAASTVSMVKLKDTD